MYKKCKKRAKNGQKMAKFKTKKNVIIFLTPNYLKNSYSGLKQLKMDLNALKCIKIHIPQKGPTNGKKCQKMSENYK